jgi:hypothetical protein
MAAAARACPCAGSAEDGASDKYGPDFMGLHVQLLDRYLRLPALALIQSAIEAGIAIHADARPLFVDAPRSAQVNSR